MTVIQLARYVSARDVVAQLGCKRSTAYEHLRRAAGREQGARGLLRVPLLTWTRYLADQARGSTAPKRWVRPTRKERREVPPIAGVYFVQIGSTGPVKIGHARDIRQRMADLQVANPEPLALLGTIEIADKRAMVARERELQARVRENWIAGEWFWPSPQLLALVRLEATG